MKSLLLLLDVYLLLSTVGNAQTKKPVRKITVPGKSASDIKSSIVSTLSEFSYFSYYQLANRL